MMKSLLDYINEKKFDKFISHKYDDEVKSALWDYVGGFTSSVNDELRKGHNVPEVTKYLDQVFMGRLAKGAELYRTVDKDYLKNIYGITKQNIDSFVGSTITCKSYMSTSSEFISPWSSKWRDEEVILHITSTKTYPCIHVNKVFTRDEIDSWNQYEVLLPRDTKLKITGYKKMQGSRFDNNLFIEVQIV